MKERLEMILKTEQMARINFGETEMTIDLHEMHQAECRWLVRTVIASSRTGFTLNLIHGYNRGTKLKEMLQKQTISKRVQRMYCDPWNPGLTHIQIAGAA